MILSTLILLILSVFLASATSIWSTYQNGNDNNGIVNFAGPVTAQLQCVSEPLNHYLISSSPVVGSDGTIYIGTFSQKLYALYPNCSIEWIFDDPLLNNGQVPTPVLGNDGTIYAANSQTLFAINPDGTKKWSYVPELGFSFSFGGEPKLNDDIIWVSASSRLLGVNSDGTLKCSFTSEGSSRSSGPSVVSTPSFDENNIYVTDLNSFYKLDFNCNKVWKVELDRAYYHIPVVVSDKIYISNYGTLFTFDKNGNRLGGFEMGGTELVTISNNLIYMGVDNKFWIFNTDGTKRCEYKATKKFVEAPVVDNEGRAYIGNKDGTLYVFNKDCQIVWKYATEGGIERAVAFGKDHTLIVPSGDRKVYIFEGSAATGASPPPSRSVIPGEVPLAEVVGTTPEGALGDDINGDQNEEDEDETPEPEERREPDLTTGKYSDAVPGEDCQSCVTVDEKLNPHLVGSCNSSKKEENCYTAIYDCRTKVVKDKRTCVSCQEGICKEPRIVGCTDTDEEDNYGIRGLVAYTEGENKNDTCFLRTAHGGERVIVERCTGPFRDVQWCYVAQYSCESRESNDTLCGDCNQGICSDVYVGNSPTEPSVICRYANNFRANKVGFVRMLGLGLATVGGCAS